ncbi:MAG: AMP-binding protein [Actinomycetota bacterium]
MRLEGARRSLRRIAAVAGPRTLARLWDARLVDRAAAAAALRSIPWLAGRGPSLGILSHLNARAFPDKEAVVDRWGTLTWSELDGRVNRLAGALASLGASPGDRVALLLRNGRELVEGVLAAQKVGVVACPLNTWARPSELRPALEQTEPRVLLYDELHADRVGELAGGMALVAAGDGENAVPGSRPYEDLLAEHPPTPPGPLTLNRGSHRIVIHTSGTTGKPRGAARGTGGGEITSILGLLTAVPLRRDDVVCIPAPMFHSFGMLTFSLAMLLGCTMVLPERFDARGTLRMVEDTGATAVALVPVMISRIVSLPEEARSGFDLSSLRIVFTSGASLGQELRARAREVLGDVLHDLYGSTEAGWVTVATPRDMARRPATVGRPVPGVEVAVFSPEGRPLGAGETGEIHVRSDATFEGYTSGEGREGRQGYLAVGDLGHLDERGYLFVEGRADDMVVVGGENVYPVEVEQVIERVAGVDEVAVVGVPDPEYGRVLAAFVAGSASEEDVLKACRAELASFKVPRHVDIVDELPRTSTGKVLKRELRAPGGP